MGRGVTLPHLCYWPGWRWGRGVTLPRLCYWPGWRDGTWCYIATFTLLTWLARWDVVLHCHIYVIDLAGEKERGVTLPHLRYWPGWRDGTWCYIATFMLLTWLARWDVVLHCHIYVTDLAGEMGRGVTLPRLCYWPGWWDGTWCYIATFMLLTWLARRNVVLHCHIYAIDLAGEMGRGVTLPHLCYWPGWWDGTWCYIATFSIDLAGEMGRSVTLPHLCYWPGWRDGTWCYIATFILLSRLARWYVVLHCHIYVTELVDKIECNVTLQHCHYWGGWRDGTWCYITALNVMSCYNMERDVLPHGAWCYVTTWNVMSCYHVERDAVLPHRTWYRVTTWNVMLCYCMEPDIILRHGTWYRVST